MGYPIEEARIACDECGKAPVTGAVDGAYCYGSDGNGWPCTGVLRMQEPAAHPAARVAPPPTSSTATCVHCGVTTHFKGQGPPGPWICSPCLRVPPSIGDTLRARLEARIESMERELQAMREIAAHVAEIE